MLLLVIFVMYWLMTSYKKEKQQLNEDIKTQLQLAYAEVKESDVTERLTYFFKSNNTDSLKIMGDSVKIQINDLRMSVDGEEQESKTQEIRSVKANILNNNHSGNIKTGISDFLIKARDNSMFPDTSAEIYFEYFDDGSPSFTLIQDEKGRPKWSKSDSLVSDERFQFPKYSDITNSDFNADIILNNVFSISESRNDKTYALFSTKLTENSLPDKYSIVENRESIPNGMRVQYTSQSFGLSNWIVDIKGVQSFIFNRMLPIILFSLFLLGTVGLAFWTLMHNYIKQQQLVKVKSEFINNMTHELKTPLATMSVALEAISGFDLAKDAEKTKEYIDISRHEVSRLTMLVDKVLNIAVFDREDSNIKMGTIKINKIIDDVIDSMKLQFDNKNAEVIFQNLSSSPSIKGDAVHLTNVVNNILDNALKYSGEFPKVDVNMTEGNGNVKIIVKDNGIGISKVNSDKVFDRFFRVPTNDQHDVKGHGLGLSYVKDVIEKHGGQILVSSVINEGTTFTVTLPKL